jgi:hypothetical protein
MRRIWDMPKGQAALDLLAVVAGDRRVRWRIAESGSISSRYPHRRRCLQ